VADITPNNHWRPNTWRGHAPCARVSYIHLLMRFASLTTLPSRALLALALSTLVPGLYAQTTPLRPGVTIEEDLSAGQVRCYSLRLKAQQFLRAVVRQRNPAVVIELLTPRGEKALDVDTSGFSKPARILWVSQTSGAYRINVSVPDKTAVASHYEITLEELRAADTDDEKRVEAERLFTQGLSEVRGNAREQAIATFMRALDLYRGVRDREREEDVLTAVGSACRDSSQRDKAIGYYEEALAISREIKDRRGEVLTLIELGIAYGNLSQNGKAIDYYEQALAIARDIKDRSGEGSALKNLGNAYMSLSKYEKAISYQEKALAIFREVKDRNAEGRALANLGVEYDRLSQYDKAIGYYDQALAIFRMVRDRRAEGMCLYALGTAYENLSQYERGIGHDEQALAISQEVNDRRFQGNVLIALGLDHADLGQYEKALRYYQQALAIERDVRDRLGESTTLFNMGNTYTDLGEFKNSIIYEEQALAIQREINEPWGEGLALMNLGWSYSKLKQYEKAIGYEEQALVIQREIKDRKGEGETLENLGDAYHGLSQHGKAIGYEEQALTIAREIKNRQGEIWALNDLGAAYHSLGRNEQAIGYYEQALAVSREVKDRNRESGALTGLMDIWRTSGKPDLAIFYGKQAVNAVQSMRSDIRGLGQELQRSFLKGNEEPYHKLAEILIVQGRLAEAEQVLALLKEEEYFQYIRRAADETSSLNRRVDLTPDEAEYEKRYREIGDRLMAIGAERGKLLDMKTRTPEQSQRLAQLEQDLAVGNQAFEHFLDDLAQHFSAKPEMTGRIEDLREAQGIMEDLRELPAGTVAIFTLIGDDKFHAILRTPDAQKAYEYPISAADLNRKILEFHEVIQDPKLDPRPLGQELYKILIGGMAEDLRQAKAQTLMWSLDGALRYVPLAALYDGKQYLIEQYRLSVMTLASNTRLKDHPDQVWKAAGFGVTKGFEDASVLPSVSSELAGIITTKPGDGGVLAGEIKLDDQFTQQSMRETLLKRYPVVHIASHFRFQPGNDAKSFLLLGDGRHLSLAELRTSANLFGGVQLLTLSACNTGVGDGTEVEGFGTLAQRQGAKAVVASLWPVADASTSRLMQEFYRIRESSVGITKLEALRQAQLELLRGEAQIHADGERDRGLVPIRESSGATGPEAPSFPVNANAPYAHPFYWAPFFLMGNWL